MPALASAYACVMSLERPGICGKSQRPGLHVIVKSGEHPLLLLSAISDLSRCLSIRSFRHIVQLAPAPHIFRPACNVALTVQGL
jgi:hypothetical protein